MSDLYETDLLFVYGSLKRNFPHPYAEKLSNHATFIGTAIFQGKMFRIRYYPAVIPSYDPQDFIHGELFKLHDPSFILPKLDAYEDYYPESPDSSLFIRTTKRTINSAGIHQNCWIYLYNRSTHNLQQITSGHFPLPNKADA